MLSNIATCGCFDYYLHAGHLALLNFAEQKAQRVTVFLVHDNTIRRLKNREPYFTQSIRAKNLKDVGVDVVRFLDDETDFEFIIEHIKLSGIDSYLFGPDQKTKFDRNLAVALNKIGIQLFYSNTKFLHSTTELLRAIKYA